MSSGYSIKIGLEFTGHLVEFVGKHNDEIFSKKPIKLKELVSLVVSRYGKKFKQAIFHNGKLAIALLVNGTIEFNFGREIGNGDKVVFLVPLAGG